MEKTKRKNTLSLVSGVISANLRKVFAFKPMLTVMIIILSAVVCSIVRDYQFAIGLAIVIFIHEIGYFFALYKRGYNVSASYSVPSFGVQTVVPNYKSREDEAFVAMTGSVFGTIATILVFIFWYVTPDKGSDFAQVLLRVSYTSILINIFNLIPVRPLDGGKIMHAVGLSIEHIGLGVLAGYILIDLNTPMLLVIWLIVFMELPKMDMKIKTYTITIAYAAMSIYMIATNQGLAQTVVLIVFGAFIVVHQFLRLKYRRLIEDKIELPQLATSKRVRVFVYYVLLFQLQFWLMLIQSKLK